MKFKKKSFFFHLENRHFYNNNNNIETNEILEIQNTSSIPYLRIASPEEIKKWGERHTITGRFIGEITDFSGLSILKPRKKGFFSEQIFGSIEPYTCACSDHFTKSNRKTKNLSNFNLCWILETIRYKNKLKHSEDIYLSYICSKCGVEYELDEGEKSKRYTTFGYIKSESPLLHPFFINKLPSFLFWNEIEVQGVLYYPTFSFLPILQNWTFFTSQSYYYYIQENSIFHNIDYHFLKPSLLKKINFHYVYDSYIHGFMNIEESLSVGDFIIPENFLTFYGINSRRIWPLVWPYSRIFSKYIDLFWIDEIIIDKPQIPYLLRQRTSFDHILKIDYPERLNSKDERIFINTNEIPETIFLQDYFLFNKITALNISYDNFWNISMNSDSDIFQYSLNIQKNIYMKNFLFILEMNNFNYLELNTYTISKKFTYINIIFIKKIKKDREDKDFDSVFKLFKNRSLFLKIRTDFFFGSLNPFWLFFRRILVLPPEHRPLVDFTSKSSLNKEEENQIFISDINHHYRLLLLATKTYSNHINTYLSRGVTPKGEGYLFSGEISSYLDDIYTFDFFNEPWSYDWNIKTNLRQNSQFYLNKLMNISKKEKTFSISLGIPKPEVSFKSLLDRLKGKTGYIRQYLLGKRVDYSGRSVIVAAPELEIYECGLPFDLALILFKPFLDKMIKMKFLKIQNFQSFEKKLFSYNTYKKDLKKIESDHYSQYEKKYLWDILNHFCKLHPILLNRAPTLHRKGIQGFIPKITQNKAIELHPLVCPAFNADFDGDQMAIHLPIAESSRTEALNILWSSLAIYGTADGFPLILPAQDMILGLNYITLASTRPLILNSSIHQIFWASLSEMIVVKNISKCYIQNGEKSHESISINTNSNNEKENEKNIIKNLITQNIGEYHILQNGFIKKIAFNFILSIKTINLSPFFQKQNVFFKTTLGRFFINEIILDFEKRNSLFSYTYYFSNLKEFFYFKNKNFFKLKKNDSIKLNQLIFYILFCYDYDFYFRNNKSKTPPKIKSYFNFYIISSFLFEKEKNKNKMMFHFVNKNKRENIYKMLIKRKNIYDFWIFIIKFIYFHDEKINIFSFDENTSESSSSNSSFDENTNESSNSSFISEEKKINDITEKLHNLMNFLFIYNIPNLTSKYYNYKELFDDVKLQYYNSLLRNYKKTTINFYFFKLYETYKTY
uniref:RNA polymerase subunit beta' n=1 Tax=Prototheca tumulicola TaxID=1737639 RepID=UPI0030027E7E